MRADREAGGQREEYGSIQEAFDALNEELTWVLNDEYV